MGTGSVGGGQGRRAKEMPSMVLDPSNAALHTAGDGLDEDVRSIDLTNVKRKLVNDEDGPGWDAVTADRAEMEYKRFLTLKKDNPALDVVPTKFIDKIWHAHILDTKAYSEDCMRVFGYFLHHFPYFGVEGPDDQAALQEAFGVTRRLFAGRFREDLAEHGRGRCKGHACHAPSSCACRTPGSCKSK